MFTKKLIFVICSILLVTLSLVSPAGLVSASNSGVIPNLVVTNTVTLEDFKDILTKLDLGFDDFGGNMGAINNQYLPQSTLFCASPQACALRLDWNFGSGGEIYTGYFFSLSGLTNTRMTFDGTNIETLDFPEHVLDLDDIDGTLIDPAGTRQFTNICFELTYGAAENVQLKLELKDTTNGVRFTRKTISGNAAIQTICWDFRNEFTVPSDKINLDPHLAKLFTLIIEQNNVDDGVNNPLTGRLDIHRIWFTLDQNESEPVDDQALLDLMEKRAYQYFLDWSSRKPASRDIPQDRSTFGDLLTVGGIGFGIPAHIIGAERGWATRADSATRVLNILRVLDDPAAFGPESVGRIGYRGWFYHFLGVDGRRKLNFDVPETPTIDESLNTVELSSIDTGLALMGVLAAQSYFDSPNDPVETEIRDHAQAIYDRIEWDFMLEPTQSQYYLGWKPNESFEGPAFDIPDANGSGKYSGVPGDPATLDYYTDEALISLLLGIGSNTHPIPPQAYQKLILDRDEAGLIRTYPGALFTYQFLHAFVDTRSFTACDPVWYNNSRQAMQNVINYATANPDGRATYSFAAWGITANDGAFNLYRANGAPSVSVNPVPEQDGSIAYYAMISAVGYGSDLRQEAIAALRAGWGRGHWHPRFGLPDAFHNDVNEITDPPSDALRQTGAWQQHALFAIDQGPMLMHLENANSGLIWRLMDKNPNIQRAFGRILTPTPTRILLQGEDGTGQGTINLRSNAWGGKTVWLNAGESRTMGFSSFSGDDVAISVRYSNDNFGTSETVTVLLDGTQVGSFVAADTGDGGGGWNIFEWSEKLPAGLLTSGDHSLTVTVADGDGYGIEIDAVAVDYFRANDCSYTSTFTSVAAKDGWTLESSETSDLGGSKNNTASSFPLGDDVANRQYRVILSFNTSGLPDNANILSASLKIKRSSTSVGKNPFTILGNLWADIRKGPFGGKAALQLADFKASASAKKVGAFKPKPVSGWYTDILNATGLSKINKTGLTQFRLYFAKDDNNNHRADYMKFFSGNASSGKPVLVITYTLP